MKRIENRGKKRASHLYAPSNNNSSYSRGYNSLHQHSFRLINQSNWFFTGCETINLIIQFWKKRVIKFLWAYRISYHEKPDIVTKLPLSPIPVHTKSKNNGLNCSHCGHQSWAWMMAWIFFIHFSLHKANGHIDKILNLMVYLHMLSLKEKKSYIFL